MVWGIEKEEYLELLGAVEKLAVTVQGVLHRIERLEVVYHNLPIPDNPDPDDSPSTELSGNRGVAESGV